MNKIDLTEDSDDSSCSGYQNLILSIDPGHTNLAIAVFSIDTMELEAVCLLSLNGNPNIPNEVARAVTTLFNAIVREFGKGCIKEVIVEKKIVFA
jgi:hypothetical protein